MIDTGNGGSATAATAATAGAAPLAAPPLARGRSPTAGGTNRLRGVAGEHDDEDRGEGATPSRACGECVDDGRDRGPRRLRSARGRSDRRYPSPRRSSARRRARADRRGSRMMAVTGAREGADVVRPSLPPGSVVRRARGGRWAGPRAATGYRRNSTDVSLRSVLEAHRVRRSTAATAVGCGRDRRAELGHVPSETQSGMPSRQTRCRHRVARRTSARELGAIERAELRAVEHRVPLAARRR